MDEWHYCTKTQWLPGVAAFPAPFNTNFHLEMALAVGGGREDFGLDDVDISALPQYLIVDYVRISQVIRCDTSVPVLKHIILFANQYEHGSVSM